MDPAPGHSCASAMTNIVANAKVVSVNARLILSARAASEVAGLMRAPQRVIPLIRRLMRDRVRITFEPRHLYSYVTIKRESADVIKLVARWILDAQRPDGGIAAYYSLLTGYSSSYPEVTGYIIPTLYDFAQMCSDRDARVSAERAVDWLLSLQMASGAFSGGLHGAEPKPSIFNTGQILQGLIRGHTETKRSEIRRAGIAAGDWLIRTQRPDGSWSGEGAYQSRSHTYYSMVAWALAELSEQFGDRRYGHAAEKNLDWVLSHFRGSGWIDGINLQGYPIYLHFIAYVLQGALECAVLLKRDNAIEAVANSARVLLRKFETTKSLPGAYETDFKSAGGFACLTGNAQMSCVWLRLYQITHDLRYLNAALKMNEMLKGLIPVRGGKGIAGGVSGSYPIWGHYQQLRYISWGCKFLLDALLLEQRVMRSFEMSRIEALSCAS
jgi:prenyltransferase beta subunit